MPELITIGETCAVIVAREIGRMRYCRDFSLRPGGAEATVAVGVKRLGHSSAWVSALGQDEMGYYILSLLGGEGVDVSRVCLIPDKPTGIFLRERLPGGDARHFYYRSGSAFGAFTPAQLDEAFIASGRILHLTGITPALSASCAETSLAAVHMAKKAGVTVSFDPNMRLNLWTAEEARPVLEELMREADLLLPGLDDMRMLYGNVSAEDAICILRDLGCASIILKCGEKDTLILENGKLTSLPVKQVERPVDLMGAGDAFAAGFLSGRLDGLSLTEAARYGTAVANLAIQMPGNIESLPTPAELELALNGGRAWNR